MNHFESKEDYLERILMISEKREYVRAIDIVNSMGFSKPSVSIALKKLKAAGYINISEHGHIVLTPDGYEIAANVYEKHKTLTSLLMILGVDEELAREDACKIEHDISDETFDKIKKFVNKPR